MPKVEASQTYKLHVCIVASLTHHWHTSYKVLRFVPSVESGIDALTGGFTFKQVHGLR